MNKLLVIFGGMVLGLSPMSTEEKSRVVYQESNGPILEATLEVAQITNAIEATSDSSDLAYAEPHFAVSEPVLLDPSAISFLEIEEEVDLGFDTEAYLPADFNPYETYFDVSAIVFLEVEAASGLGYDTATFLPEGFDPHTEVVSMASINFMEEEEIVLGFDAAEYLPQGFDAYGSYKEIAKMEFEAIDIENDLGFDAQCNLPVGFDAFEQVVSVDSIQFMGDETVELGFDTSNYLPEDFDPYAGSK